MKTNITIPVFACTSLLSGINATASEQSSILAATNQYEIVSSAPKDNNQYPLNGTENNISYNASEIDQPTAWWIERAPQNVENDNFLTVGSFDVNDESCMPLGSWFM